jgi:xanthine dehydrogenase accessory factor
MASIYDSVVELLHSGKTGALCSVIHTQGSTPRHEGSKMLVYSDGHSIGTVGGGEIENRVHEAAMQAMRDGKTQLLHYNMSNPGKGDPGICGGQVDVLVEPLLRAPQLLVIGGGHVGKALTHLAKWLGFRVIMSDDRFEFCNTEYHPEADEFLPVSMAEIPSKFTISSDTYIVLTTRGSDIDIEGLPPILSTKPAYIGAIGSKRRWIITRKALEAKGILPETLDKISSPIGIEIQAETPEEIAVSIMAEIIKVRNDKSD